MYEHLIYVHVVICVVVILATFSLSAFLSMFSFAVASYKCSSLSDIKKKDVIDATAKRLLYSSEKIASIVYLAKRFALVLSILSLYYLFEICCTWIGFEKCENSQNLLYFIPIAILAIWLQHAIFDLTAIKYGKNNSEDILIKYSKAFYLIYILMMPFYFLAISINRKISKKLKIKKGKDFESIDVELMLSAKEMERTISQYTGKIVRNAIKLQDLDVSDVMLPRSKVVYLNAEDTNEQNLETIRKTGFTRYPLCKGNLDDCYGIIHIREILMRNLFL